MGRRGNAVDNWDQGGISIGLDLRTGVLNKGIIKPKYGGQWVDVHPDSGVPFTGLQMRLSVVRRLIEKARYADAMAEMDLVQKLWHDQVFEMRAFVQEAYPQWQAEHKGTKCPAKLEDLAKYFGENPGIPVTSDPWGHALVMKCDEKAGVSVLSVGEDGKEGTEDDVRAP